MKILILSPYTNVVLRSHLEMKEYGSLAKFFIDKFGFSGKVKIKDIAPWVGDLIGELEKQDDIDIVSVAPQIKMAKKIQQFQYKKTKYYYYSSDFSQAARLVKSYKLWKILETCSRRVRKIVDIERPDIIILFGTENLTISAPILSLTDYPIFCILQTVYHKPDRAKYSKPDKMIMQLESEIANKIKFFGTGKTLGNLLKQINPHVTLLDYKWISGPLPEFKSPPKKYDFINFAYTMDLRKGDEDSVRALFIVKEKYRDVTLNIAGGMAEERERYIKGIVSELGLQDNVSFTPLFEQKEDMYQHVLQARFAVLPVKLDLVSTTTREAMFYGIPVVTNITPGTPFLNKDKDCVLLAEKGNVESLANRMLQLMNDDALAKLLAENAHEYIVNQIDNTKKTETLIRSLRAIIDNYIMGTSIPERLLLKVETDNDNII